MKRGGLDTCILCFSLQGIWKLMIQCITIVDTPVSNFDQKAVQRHNIVGFEVPPQKCLDHIQVHVFEPVACVSWRQLLNKSFGGVSSLQAENQTGGQKYWLKFFSTTAIVRFVDSSRSGFGVCFGLLTISIQCPRLL